MKIVHRISLRLAGSRRKALEALGLKVPTGIAMPGGGDPLVAFDIAEDQPNWLQVRALLQQWDVSEGQVRTEFSTKEIDAARWLEIGAWHHGYPQPDEDVFGYRQTTYELTDWCEQCGIGKKQKASFQMKGEPKWGGNGILQLIWIYDEIFVKPEVWSDVFKPQGIGYRPITDTKSIELKTVVQIVVKEETGIVSAGLPSERCSNCGRVKYLPITRGLFPALAEEPSSPIARTREYFGSGGQADQSVLISQELARTLAAAKIRGASLRPVIGKS